MQTMTGPKSMAKHTIYRKYKNLIMETITLSMHLTSHTLIHTPTDLTSKEHTNHPKIVKKSDIENLLVPSTKTQ